MRGMMDKDQETAVHFTSPPSLNVTSPYLIDFFIIDVNRKEGMSQSFSDGVSFRRIPFKEVIE